MRKLPRFRISGRAAIATLAIVSLAVVGGILFLPKKALAATGTVKPTVYGPLMLQERSDAPGIHTILIGLLVPAVQATDTPFTVEAIVDGGGPGPVLSVPRSNGQSMSFFDVFTELTIDGGFMLHLRNLKTGDEATAPATAATRIAIRLLPAVQRNGQIIPAISANLTAMGANGVQVGETAIDMPFQNQIVPFMP